MRLFRILGSPLYGTSHGGQPGPLLCSVACLRGGHLTLRLASTVHGFSSSTSPIPTAKALGATKHGRSAHLPCPPLFCPSARQRGQVASGMRDAVSLGSTSFLGFESRSMVSGERTPILPLPSLSTVYCGIIPTRGKCKSKTDKARRIKQ